MIHLKKFNENKDKDKDNELTIHTIMMHMMHIIDDYDVYFFDANFTSFSPKDIKEDTKFDFYLDNYNRRVNNFKIKIVQKLNYEQYLTLCDDMLQVINFLKEYNWEIFDFGCSKNTNPLSILDISYKFGKSDIIITPKNSLEEKYSKETISRIFYNNTIEVNKRDIIYNYVDDRECIDIEDYFYEYDDIRSRLDDIVEELGAEDWDFYNGKNSIYIKF